MMLADAQTTLPDNFLVKVDRASMAVGLEAGPGPTTSIREYLNGLVLISRPTDYEIAGIPLDTKTAYFVKGYEGELTPEAIREAAVAAEFIPASAPAVSAEEQATHERTGAGGLARHYPQLVFPDGEWALPVHRRLERDDRDGQQVRGPEPEVPRPTTT